MVEIPYSLYLWPRVLIFFSKWISVSLHSPLPISAHTILPVRVQLKGGYY